MPKRLLLIAGTFLLSMLLYVDRVCISVAEEPIVAELGFTGEQMGIVLSAFALGYSLFQTPGGLLADRFGPRIVLTAVVCFWSFFTALTGAAWNLVSMVVTRFFFGAGEAGAFPSCARAVYSWVPVDERGILQAINFSGTRIGAAFAMPAVAALISVCGWRLSFLVLGLVGIAWAIFWYTWFRDDPESHPRISEHERNHILKTRQRESTTGRKQAPLSVGMVLGSRNMWLVMAQYFASNFTFFFCLTWFFPHLKKTYDLEAMVAGWYTALPFLLGAAGNWVAGAMVDSLYIRGHWRLSRCLTAAVGFALATGGLVAMVYTDTAFWTVACFSLAIFGADMTLSPSWSVCIDIGRRHSGAVSGTMNMAGNLGSFVTALAFPILSRWAGSPTPFFFVGAGLNILAIVAWLFIRPERPLEDY